MWKEYSLEERTIKREKGDLIDVLYARVQLTYYLSLFLSLLAHNLERIFIKEQDLRRIVGNPIWWERERSRKKEAKNVGKKKTPSEEQVLAEMKRLAANGIVECTSTLLRDKLALDKESGRDQIRRAMKALEKDGKVESSRKTEGRKQFVYKLAKK